MKPFPRHKVTIQPFKKVQSAQIGAEHSIWKGMAIGFVLACLLQKFCEWQSGPDEKQNKRI